MSNLRDNWMWLAGLLEGEASFHTTLHTSGNRSPCLALYLTDRDTVERAAVLAAPRARILTAPGRKATHTDQHGWAIHGGEAMGIAMILYPYLSSRRRQQVEYMWTQYCQRAATGPRTKHVFA